MKKFRWLTILFSVLTLCALCFAGCSDLNDAPAVYVTTIKPTGNYENETVYTIYYSDGTTSEITVSNGTDGKDGSVSIDELYEKYVKEVGEISYADFLREYLTFSEDSTIAIGKCLQSSLKVYSTFVSKTMQFTPGGFLGMGGSVSYTYTLGYAQGSAVIYRIQGDDVYVVTNYHVIYNTNADATANGGYFAQDIYCYLYGSEDEPQTTEETNATYGYSLYDFGEYAVKCEYIGGSATADLAVLKIKRSELAAINEDFRAVTPAEEYTVGETAIAIGNTEGEGISVTKGIVSVDNEDIVLNVDGTLRTYRCLRIDTSIYSGNSGGGLFNAAGQLIGITNAGNTEDQNINYAIPVSIVTGTVDNIIDTYLDGDPDTNGVYKVTLGVTLSAQHTRYIYDEASVSGVIKEDLVVESVSGIAEQIGLAEGDILVGFVIDETEYALNRTFDLSDVLLKVRAGSVIKVPYTRNGADAYTDSYTVVASDLSPVV